MADNKLYIVPLPTQIEEIVDLRKIMFDSSGDVENAAAQVTLTPDSGKRVYLKSFFISGQVAIPTQVNVTITGLIDPGTLTYCYHVSEMLHVDYHDGIPASDVDVPIVLSCPSLGVAANHLTLVILGYQL